MSSLFHLLIQSLPLLDNLPHTGYFTATSPEELKTVSHQVFGLLTRCEITPIDSLPPNTTSASISDLAKLRSQLSAQYYLAYNVMCQINKTAPEVLKLTKTRLDELEYPQREGLRRLLNPL